MLKLKELAEVSTGKREFIVDGLPANVSIGIVVLFRSSPLATSVPVLP